MLISASSILTLLQIFLKAIILLKYRSITLSSVSVTHYTLPFVFIDLSSRLIFCTPFSQIKINLDILSLTLTILNSILSSVFLYTFSLIFAFKLRLKTLYHLQTICNMVPHLNCFSCNFIHYQ